jgi:hypothetical protein
MDDAGSSYHILYFSIVGNYSQSFSFNSYYIGKNLFLHDDPFNDLKIVTNVLQFFAEEICFESHIEKG